VFSIRFRYEEKSNHKINEKIREKIDLLIEKTDTDKENEEFDNDLIFHSLDQDTVDCICNLFII
jgi:hypothetical protein